MALRAGYIGQIKGPFLANQNILANIDIPIGYQLKWGISITPKDLMPYPEWYFIVNDQYIKMGKTGMYEVDEPMIVSNISFPLGAPASTLIEFIVYE